MLLSTLLLMSGAIVAQVEATYSEVASKQKKGILDRYTAESGQVLEVGDTVKIGYPATGENFNHIWQDAGIQMYPCYSSAGNSMVVIKSIRATSRLAYLKTTKPNGYVYGLLIQVEAAMQHGELLTPGQLTSDEALEALKKAKDKLDLELITPEEYQKEKDRLSPLIR